MKKTSTASLALLQAALEQAADPVFIVNKQGKLLYANQTYKRLIGPAGFGRIMEVAAELTDSLKPLRTIQRIRAKNGKQLYVDETITPIRIGSRADNFIIMWKDITKDYRNYEKINRHAYYDSLTGLPNRTMLLERIETVLKSARSEKHHAAVFFIDIDKFKPINDNYGHAIGDAVLKIIAQRLKSSVRGTDTVGRLGGDEFIVFLDSIGQKTEALRIVREIIKRLQKPFKVGRHSFALAASIGIALFPEHAQSCSELLHQADLAMKMVEKQGGGDYHMLESSSA